MLAAAAKRDGSRSAHFSAPYPPIDSPATYVSSGPALMRKNDDTSSGSSSLRNVQYRWPCRSSA